MNRSTTSAERGPWPRRRPKRADSSVNEPSPSRADPTRASELLNRSTTSANAAHGLVAGQSGPTRASTSRVRAWVELDLGVVRDTAACRPHSQNSQFYLTISWDLTGRRDPSRPEPSLRRQPTRAEPSRPDAGRAEPSRPDASRAEPSRASDAGRAEPTRASELSNRSTTSAERAPAPIRRPKGPTRASTSRLRAWIELSLGVVRLTDRPPTAFAELSVLSDDFWGHGGRRDPAGQARAIARPAGPRGYGTTGRAAGPGGRATGPAGQARASCHTEVPVLRNAPQGFVAAFARAEASVSRRVRAWVERDLSVLRLTDRPPTNFAELTVLSDGHGPREHGLAAGRDSAPTDQPLAATALRLSSRRPASDMERPG